MNQDTSNHLRRPVAASVAAGAVVLAAIILPFCWWRSPEIQVTLRPWMQGTTRTGFWAPIDDSLKRLGGSGNLAVRFDGFTRDNSDHLNTAATWSNRGGYKLYPRRVFVADEGTVIGTGMDVLEARFNPTLQWLRLKHVEILVTLTPGGGSHVFISPVIVPPAGSAP